MHMHPLRELSPYNPLGLQDVSPFGFQSQAFGISFLCCTSQGLGNLVWGTNPLHSSGRRSGFRSQGLGHMVWGTNPLHSSGRRAGFRSQGLEYLVWGTNSLHSLGRRYRFVIILLFVSSCARDGFWQDHISAFPTCLHMALLLFVVKVLISFCSSVFQRKLFHM